MSKFTCGTARAGKNTCLKGSPATPIIGVFYLHLVSFISSFIVSSYKNFLSICQFSCFLIFNFFSIKFSHFPKFVSFDKYFHFKFDFQKQQKDNSHLLQLAHLCTLHSSPVVGFRNSKIDLSKSTSQNKCLARFVILNFSQKLRAG